MLTTRRILTREEIQTGGLSTRFEEDTDWGSSREASAGCPGLRAM